MKICLIALGCLSIALNSYSQIEVSESQKKITVSTIKNAGTFVAELSYKLSDKDTLYTITFDNAKYQTISDFQSVSFLSTDNTRVKLYDIIRTFFTDENKKNKDYKVELKLGNDNVILSNERMMGVTQVMFFTSKGYFLLTEKMVNKLFNK